MISTEAASHGCVSKYKTRGHCDNYFKSTQLPSELLPPAMIACSMLQGTIRDLWPRLSTRTVFMPHAGPRQPSGGVLTLLGASTTKANRPYHKFDITIQALTPSRRSNHLRHEKSPSTQTRVLCCTRPWPESHSGQKIGPSKPPRSS